MLLGMSPTVAEPLMGFAQQQVTPKGRAGPVLMGFGSSTCHLELHWDGAGDSRESSL